MYDSIHTYMYLCARRPTPSKHHSSSVALGGIQKSVRDLLGRGLTTSEPIECSSAPRLLFVG